MAAFRRARKWVSVTVRPAIQHSSVHLFCRCQGVLNDYCRIVGDGDGFFSCVLAGGNPTGGKDMKGDPEYTHRAEYSPGDFTAQRIHKKCFNGLANAAPPNGQLGQPPPPIQITVTRRRRRRRLTNASSTELAPLSHAFVDTNPPPIDPSKKTIAVLLPMTSREMMLKELKMTPLNRIVIRSMADTLKADRTKFNGAICP